MTTKEIARAAAEEIFPEAWRTIMANFQSYDANKLKRQEATAIIEKHLAKLNQPQELTQEQRELAAKSLYEVATGFPYDPDDKEPSLAGLRGLQTELRKHGLQITAITNK